MKPPICFDIETKARELDSRLLVGLMLAARGFPVLIGSRGAIQRESSFLNGVVFVGKSVSPSSLAYYDRIRSKGGKVVLMDEEGGVYYGDGSDGVLSRIPQRIVPSIDFCVVFGDAIKELMARLLGGIRAGAIHVTGNPRFDLVKARFDGFFAPEVLKITREYGDYVLINTSFAMANGFKKGPALINWIERHENLTPHLKKVMKRHLPIQEDIHRKVIELALSLSARFPETNFVLRPHPSEDERTYEAAFAGRKNLFVKKEGNVAIWIRGARAVIHNDCTTAIESKIAGKFVVSYCPVTDPELLVWLPVFVSDVEATSPAEVESHLERLFEAPPTRHELPESKIARVERYIANLRCDAYPKVAETLEAELSSFRPVGNPWRLSWGNLKLRCSQRLRARLDGLLILFNTRILGQINEADDKYRGIGLGELRAKTRVLGALTGIQARFKVRKFAHECFLISADSPGGSDDWSF